MTHRPWLDATSTAAEMPPNGGVLPPGLLKSSAAASPSDDRRVSPRRPHRVFQWIAPCIDGRLPDQSMFYQVQCIDISRTGISFYTYEDLPSDEVIIAIGTTVDAVYVRSRVANCARLEDSDGVRYRVGCEFVERMGPKQQQGSGQ
jgi:hypothetical protein